MSKEERKRGGGKRERDGEREGGSIHFPYKFN